MSSVNVEAEKKIISQLIIDAWKNEVEGNLEALCARAVKKRVWGGGFRYRYRAGLSGDIV